MEKLLLELCQIAAYKLHFSILQTVQIPLLVTCLSFNITFITFCPIRLIGSEKCVAIYYENIRNTKKYL